MVQVLPANPTKRPSFLESIATGMGPEIQPAVQGYFDTRKQQALQGQQNEALKKAGFGDLIGLPPDAQKVAIGERLKGEEKRKTKESEMKLEQNMLDKAFGEEGFEEKQLPKNKLPQKTLENLSDEKLRSLIATKTYGAAAKDILKSRREGGIKAKPTPPEISSAIENVIKEFPNASPDELMIEFDKAEIPRTYVDNYIENRRRSVETEAKREESRYGLQKDFINDTTSRYSAFETDMKPKLLQMQNIPDEDLISPTTAVFLDALGIPLGALEDPSSQLYQKLSLDLLKGLPETFGNRILKVEVDNFLKTIPSLTNSSEGRRMIASNMLKLGEMKEVYYNEMRKQQSTFMDSDKPLPLDFQQRVFDQVKPQINKINNEFAKLSEIKSVPKDTIPFFNPNGDIEFVPKQHAQWAESNGGKRIW